MTFKFCLIHRVEGEASIAGVVVDALRSLLTTAPGFEGEFVRLPLRHAMTGPGSFKSDEWKPQGWHELPCPRALSTQT